MIRKADTLGEHRTREFCKGIKGLASLATGMLDHLLDVLAEALPQNSGDGSRAPASAVLLGVKYSSAGCSTSTSQRLRIADDIVAAQVGRGGSQGCIIAT
jgi:hypothetical protein